MRKAFINTILSNASAYPELIVLSGDAGLGVFDDFKEQYPDRFINTGIAEQNAIGMAAGLAMTGHKVIIYNIAPFTLYRCYEQVRNDICYQGLPVILVGIGSGLTYAPAGMTHYALEDIGVCRTIPDLQVFSPSDPVEAGKIAEFCIETKYPTYVRLAKQGEPILHSNTDIDITLPQVIREGSTTALICHGSISSEVIDAHRLLKKEGISSRVITIPRVKPLHIDTLKSMLKDIRHIVSIEEHYKGCGVGSSLLFLSMQNGLIWNIDILGIEDGFIHDVKNQSSLRQHFGISSEKICRIVKQKMG